MSSPDTSLKRSRSPMEDLQDSDDGGEGARPAKKQALVDDVLARGSDSLAACVVDKGKGKETETQENIAQEVLDGLQSELECPCCQGLMYRPMLLNPCHHAFCASCITLWVKNGGTACPACRSAPSSMFPARILQKLIDLLLHFRPECQRSLKEREQADEIWMPGDPLTVPPARRRDHSPPPLPINLARPCPHCLPGNQMVWTCPVPIPDPNAVPRDQAWDLDSQGIPPGHGFCAGCDELHAIAAPPTIRCSFCNNVFCGYSVPATCIVPRISNPQMPRSLDTVAKLLECDEFYGAFSHNSIEVDILIDYLRTKPGLNTVLRSILDHVRTQPQGFAALEFLSDGLPGPAYADGVPQDDMSDSEDEGGEDLPMPQPRLAAPVNVAAPHVEPAQGGGAAQGAQQQQALLDIDDPGEDMEIDYLPLPVFLPAPQAAPPPAASSPAAPAPVPVAPVDPAAPAPRPLPTKICRDCAEGVFTWGIYEWWVRERRAVPNAVPVDVRSRPDCRFGRMCEEQNDVAHAREFNHICEPRPPTPAPAPAHVDEDPVAVDVDLALSSSLGRQSTQQEVEALLVVVRDTPEPEPAVLARLTAEPEASEQVVEEMLGISHAPVAGPAPLSAQQQQQQAIPLSVAIQHALPPLIHDVNMDDEAEVERQMEQYLNLDVGVMVGL